MSQTLLKSPPEARPPYLDDIAVSLLDDTLLEAFNLKRSFLKTLQSEEVAEGVANPATFAGILRYVIAQGFIQQYALARRIEYANSQVGRWAANKAAPPVIVRRAVIEEIRHMLEEDLDSPKSN